MFVWRHKKSKHPKIVNQYLFLTHLLTTAFCHSNSIYELLICDTWSYSREHLADCFNNAFLKDKIHTGKKRTAVHSLAIHSFFFPSGGYKLHDRTLSVSYKSRTCSGIHLWPFQKLSIKDKGMSSAKTSNGETPTTSFCM